MDIDKGLIQASNGFHYVIRNWNRGTFGNIFRKKNHLMIRLEGIDCKLENNFNAYFLQIKQNYKGNMNKSFCKRRWLGMKNQNTNGLTIGTKNIRHFMLTLWFVERTIKLNF